MNKFNLGDRIYYTGDMANASGWLEVTGYSEGIYVDCREIEGERREFPKLFASSIGTKYEGHCNPRFVTAEAYQAWRDEKLTAFAS